MIGALVSILKPAPTSVSICDLALTAILGLLIALAKPLPSLIPLIITFQLGLLIGWSNATEITSQMSPLRFVTGLALVGLLLVTYGVGLVRRLDFEWSRIAVRVVGSWLAAIGILVLGLR